MGLLKEILTCSNVDQQILVGHWLSVIYHKKLYFNAFQFHCFWIHGHWPVVQCTQSLYFVIFNCLLDNSEDNENFSESCNFEAKSSATPLSSKEQLPLQWKTKCLTTLWIKEVNLFFERIDHPPFRMNKAKLKTYSNENILLSLPLMFSVLMHVNSWSWNVPKLTCQQVIFSSL